MDAWDDFIRDEIEDEQSDMQLDYCISTTQVYSFWQYVGTVQDAKYRLCGHLRVFVATTLFPMASATHLVLERIYLQKIVEEAGHIAFERRMDSQICWIGVVYTVWYCANTFYIVHHSPTLSYFPAPLRQKIPWLLPEFVPDQF